MSSPPAPLALAAHLAVLSMISFGGIPSVLPDIHNLVVVTKPRTTTQAHVRKRRDVLRRPVRA
jgi:chromate transport protein ChrA